MKISVVTLFPALYTEFLQTSVIKTAIEKRLVEIQLINVLSLSSPKVRVDEPTVGPGPGMILKPEIIEKAIALAQETFGVGFKVFFSPKGIVLDQLVLNNLASALMKPCENSDNALVAEKSVRKHLILVCSRYEGIDHRVETEFADLLLSIGDYVTMGGDLPAQVFLEAFLRLVPQVLGNQASVEHDSFQSPLLDHPEYGYPLHWRGQTVPEVLTSGHHAKIHEFRQENALQLTLERRFDWLRTHPQGKNYQEMVLQQIPKHYVVLMHEQVETGQGVGVTSVTSIDLHDIARSCATYAVKNFFVVTPLHDQQIVVRSLVDYWHQEENKNRNQSRFDAVKNLVLVDHLVQVIEEIEKNEGAKPLLVTTSAKSQAGKQSIDFFAQGLLWQQKRPILFVFGTGRGLSEDTIAQSDYLLRPVEGFSDYNHLSVRSAVAIILDRWFGFNPKERMNFDQL